jgi:hypothetical protein
MEKLWIIPLAFAASVLYAQWAAYCIMRNSEKMLNSAILKDRMDMIKARMRVAGYDEPTINRELPRIMGNQAVSRDIKDGERRAW